MALSRTKPAICGIRPTSSIAYLTLRQLIALSSRKWRSAIDLTIDPAPDLAIEVDHTSSSLNRLGIYGALGVMEVWQYDRDSLRIWSLGDQGYQPSEVSVVLPMFDAVVLRSFLELSQTVGETSLMRHVRQWVREQLNN